MAHGGFSDAEDFVRARLDALRRFAYLISGSAAEADDLAQIAVVEVWQRWRRARENPEAYARQVIVTRNVSRWRRWRREVPSEELEHRPDDPAGTAVSNGALWQALRTLGKAERTVVVLHVLYRYTFSEIAGICGEPPGTVSSRYARAKRALQAHLGTARQTIRSARG
jgi:RNA polymerase sigma factor (sigma-70 family)